MSTGNKVANSEQNISGELKEFILNGYIDRNDIRWFHPEFHDYLRKIMDTEITAGNTYYLCDKNIPLEERLDTRQKIYELLAAMKKQQLDNNPALRDFGENKIYEAPGCEEESETPVKILLRTPKIRTEEKLPVIFYAMGGALVMASPDMHPLPELCKEHNSVVICPCFRSSVDASYPSALNDLHAAYKWMVENADEIGIDTDRIIIYGGSSGGHLASSLLFRLKRYEGYNVHPRGVILIDPILDDRYVFHSHKYLFHMSDSRAYHTFNKFYMGDTNFGSPYISPEAYANRAQTEDCRGLPPIFIHTGEMDPERDSCFDFAKKLYEANVFTEVHQWGGCFHAIQQVPHSDFVKRYELVISGNINDCLNNDSRRLWNNC